MKKKEVTIYDVANTLKLSPATISRALSGLDSVHPQTRAKIVKAANDLGYQRNFSASSLKTRKNRLIAAMVTQLNTPIASCVLSGAEVTASELGYSMIVSQSRNRPEIRTANIENLSARRVEGLLVTSAYFQEYDFLKEFAKLKIPVIVIEGSSMLPGHPKKKAGDLENAIELTEYLINKGCRRISYFAVGSDSGQHQQLIAGYRKALQHRQRQDANVWVNGDIKECWSDMCRMLTSTTPRPDGIIFSNHSITAMVFRDPDSSSGNRNEFWITCRKGARGIQNQLLMELGKVAAGLVICLGESMQTAVADDMSVLSKRPAVQPIFDETGKRDWA